VKLEEFTDKLATIQADEHLTIETTIDIKQKIVGTKKLWDCSSTELDNILDEYRKEYMKSNVEKVITYRSKYKHKKSKNKYSARKDWD
jgi:hypothetical protein|tara:strand:+ start:82 stop:345 length:264 start_codon:yes stop_codon:yes gene_type:complete